METTCITVPRDEGQTRNRRPGNLLRGDKAFLVFYLNEASHLMGLLYTFHPTHLLSLHLRLQIQP